MHILKLALASLLNRRIAALLTVLSVALSVLLLLGVEKLRRDTRSGFANTVSGTDLIVGARGGSVQLLLHSVFRIGNATHDISWATYQTLASRPGVAWSVPITLGDSHRGYPVLGTTGAYFDHYRYGNRQPLRLATGRPFEAIFDVVLGAEVARELDYAPGADIVLSHGTGELESSRHRDQPFTVVGVLAPTGTPVDRTLHVGLAGIEAIHAGWEGGMRSPVPVPALKPGPSEAREPSRITAFLMGLERRTQMVAMQRSINEFEAEPLQAIMPGVALQELWDLMRIAEQSLRFVSAFVVVTSLLGMLTAVLTSLQARRREMAVLRAVGARRLHLIGLFVAESGLLTGLGALLGLALLMGITALGQTWVQGTTGLFLPLRWPVAQDWAVLAAVLGAALVLSLAPALWALRLSLADGLSVRL